jgi:L-fuculose-phosphate aldolase
MKTDWEARREMAAFGEKVYKSGLVAAMDGNISIRVFSDRLLITPSGSCLGTLNIEDLVYVDLEGQVLVGRVKPSSELPMHIEIYKKRPDILAIIHAHPPLATAFTIAGKNISQPVIPEVFVQFGQIPVAPYAPPSSKESVEFISDIIEKHDLILLDHHGAVAVGKSLYEAYLKMEKLEHTASTLIAAEQLGQITPLSQSELENLKKAYNISGTK